MFYFVGSNELQLNLPLVDMKWIKWNRFFRNEACTWTHTVLQVIPLWCHKCQYRKRRRCAVWSCVVMSRATFRQLVDAHAGIHPSHLVYCCVDAPAGAPWTGLPSDPRWGSICSGVEAAAGRQPPASSFFFFFFSKQEAWEVKGDRRMPPWRGRVYFEGWRGNVRWDASKKHFEQSALCPQNKRKNNENV